MTREELQRLARTELIEMVLEQQAQIEKLETTLAEVESRLVQAEAQGERPAGRVSPASSQEEMAEPAEIQQWAISRQRKADN